MKHILATLTFLTLTLSALADTNTDFFISSNGIPVTTMDVNAWREKLNIALTGTTLVPEATATNGQTLITQNGLWVVATVAEGGGGTNIPSISAIAPLNMSTDTNGAITLSVSAVWITTNAAQAMFAPLSHSQSVSTITGIFATNQIPDLSGIYLPLHGSADNASRLCGQLLRTTVTNMQNRIPFINSANDLSISESLTFYQLGGWRNASIFFDGDYLYNNGSMMWDDGNLTTNGIPGLNAWMTGSDYRVSRKENAFANPSISPQFLTSTTGGTRSWATIITNMVSGFPAFNDWAASSISSKASTNHTQGWSTITNPPATYAPSAHGHPESEVTGLQGDLGSLWSVVNSREPGIPGNSSAYVWHGDKVFRQLDYGNLANKPTLYSWPSASVNALPMYNSPSTLKNSGITRLTDGWGFPDNIYLFNGTKAVGGYGTPGRVAKWAGGVLLPNINDSIIRDDNSGTVGVGGSLVVDSTVDASHSSSSIFRGRHKSQDGTDGIDTEVMVRNMAGTGVTTLKFKNGLFIGAE